MKSTIVTEADHDLMKSLGIKSLYVREDIIGARKRYQDEHRIRYVCAFFEVFLEKIVDFAAITEDTDA